MRISSEREYILMACAVFSKLIVVCLGLQLSLEESVTNNCGRLSYAEPAVAGRNVTLTFEPVLANSDTVIWYTWHLDVWQELSETWYNYDVNNFSLVVKTDTKDRRGSFYTKYGSCYSKTIMLKLIERPNNPEILNKQSIDGCRNCIFGVLNSYLAIRCNVTGGTTPLSVNITVSGERMGVSLGTDGIYTASVRLTARRHITEVSCSVTNIALDSPLLTEATIYIPVKPESVTVALAESYSAILPYYAYNLSCVIRRAYPACSAQWLIPESVDELYSTESYVGTNAVTTEAEISLNVTREDNGKEVVCTALCANIKFKQSEVHVISVLYLPDQHKSAKTDDQTFSTIIVSVMACIVLLLAAIVLGVVLKRRNSKNSEMVQDDSAVPAAGLYGSVVSYASVQESDTYSTPLPKSQRLKADTSKTVQDDDTYAMPLPKSQRNNANTANVKSADERKELIYADLDLQPSSTSGSGAMAKPVMRKDGPETEYVDIDFNKKAVSLPDSEAEDNVHANQ